MSRKIKIDITKKYGRLQPIVCIGSVKGAITWVCRCDCGEKVKVAAANLVSGHTKSCGCLRRDMTSASNIGSEIRKTHSMSNTPEYNAWRAMKSRCSNPNDKDYKNWGGRGIKVYARWLESFENFYEDMGEKPWPKLLYSLDRINNDGNYEPSNCRWATRKQQNNNMRKRKKGTNVRN